MNNSMKATAIFEPRVMSRFLITFKLLVFLTFSVMFCALWIYHMAELSKIAQLGPIHYPRSMPPLREDPYLPSFPMSFTYTLLSILGVGIISYLFLGKICIKRIREIGENPWIWGWTLLLPIYNQYAFCKLLFQYEPSEQPHTLKLFFKECLTILIAPFTEFFLFLTPISKNDLLLKLPAFWIVYGITLRYMYISHWFVFIPYIWASILFFRYAKQKSLIWKIVAFIPIYREVFFGISFVCSGKED